MDNELYGLVAIQEKKMKAMSACVTMFVLVILTIFPLYTRDYYFDILPEKYKFYYISALSIVGISFLLLLKYAIMKYRYLIKFEKKEKHFITGGAVRQVRNMMSTEKCTIIFLMCAGLSTMFSDYTYEAFWGNEGRFSGFFLLLLYGIPLILIGRYGKCKIWLINAFLVSSMFLCLFGITDYFSLNLLGFKNDVAPGEWQTFFSTIGNINTYTSFVALVVGASVVLFSQATKRLMKIVYYICMLISFLALIMGISDNAYLSLGAILGFLPFFLFRKRDGVKSYLIIIATLFTAVFIVALADALFPEHVLGMDGLAKILVSSGYLEWVVVMAWGIVGGYTYITQNSKVYDEALANRRMRIWTVCMIAVVCIVVFVIIDANLMGHAQKYSAISSYIVFNDEWGSLRGYVWRLAIEAYDRFPIIHKLFGYGPDTFGIITTQYARREMLELYAVIFDNTHNEFLHYFICTGLLGGTAYILIIVTLIIRMCKNAKNSPAVAALLFSIIGYVAQSTVNINPPIVTPIFWVLMGLGLAGTNKNGKETW